MRKKGDIMYNTMWYTFFRILGDGVLTYANSDDSNTTQVAITSLSFGDWVATKRNDDGRYVLANENETFMIDQDGARKIAKQFDKGNVSKHLEALGFHETAIVKCLANGAEHISKVKDLIVGVCRGNERTSLVRFRVANSVEDYNCLLNASEPTNIVYRIKGLTKEQAQSINNITGPRKIMDRCRAIKNLATSIEYDTYYSEIFKDNLEVVDSSLPQMLADLVKVHYFQQILLPRPAKKRGGFREADRISSAVEMLSATEPYASKTRRNFCEIKFKRFLRACALGLMPSEVWNGIDDASGGYIIVLPDGRLVALYVYNTNLFEQYLYESTIFERASTTRHHYLALIPDGETGDFLLKLNLQIRFNK